MYPWDRLDKQMRERSFLTGKNPVLVAINSLPLGQGAGALQQYCSLVHMIIVYLGLGLERIPVREVREELARNIAEEQGSRTNGIPHRELLAKLFLQEFQISTFAPWSEGTLDFHVALLTELKSKASSPEYVAGMIYALEATARLELEMVSDIINAYAGYKVVDIVKALGDPSRLAKLLPGEITSLEDFIVLHITQFEFGHESGLRNTLEPFICTNIPAFTAGFEFVLDQMDKWWATLAREVYHNS